MMVRLAIYGPGGFGREIVGIATDPCFVSDRAEDVGRTILGAPVYDLDQLAAMRAAGEMFEAVIAVAEAAVRRKLDDKLASAEIPLGSAIAASAVIGGEVEIAAGAILCHNTTITASARIGRHFHANIYSYVAHDCVVGDFVTLAPRVCINGNTVLEDDVYVGTGAILKQGTPDKPLRIGKGAVIGMGAVVTKDVAPGTVVVGNPARALGSH